MKKKGIKEFVTNLVYLYGDFCDALVEREKKGGAKYSDEDFRDFESFIKFLRNNYL